MDVEIIVSAVEGGWKLHLTGVGGDQHFASGAAAESAACRLAQRLADTGRSAEVSIYLRDGSMSARRRYGRA
jgi:hypothetical protein